MRKMTQLTPYNQQTLMTSAFYGYNHNEIISNGEMYDMQNMGNDQYPLLCPRKKRGISSYDVSGQASVPLTGIHGRDQLVFIRGTEVFYNFNKVTGLTVSANQSDLPKQIVSFGAYVLIFPDKKYFNTVHLSDYGSMDRLFSISGANVSLNLCRADGTNYDMTAISVGGTAPASPTNGKLWIDESTDTAVLRQYSSATQEWVEVPTVYVKIGASGIGTGIKEYDTVEISGLEAQNGAAAKTKAQVMDLNGSMIVYGRGDNYIIVAGILDATIAAAKSQTVRADIKVPDMDYICESNNRLWGCKYGYDSAAGAVMNEIRASKLGDFRNWSNFMGLSTDSWTASVGTDGPFTGCAVQRGYPVFFKENCIHRVSGTMPSSFSITTTMCRGVQSGCWKSVCVVNEAIYYKSRGGVMVFDGSMPESVSDALGDILYSDARAGQLDGKYYICMKDRNNHYFLFNYDTKHGTWQKEDNTKALGFGTVNDELFYIDEVNNTLVAVRGSVGTAEADFDWAAEFDLYGVNYIAASSSDDPRRVRNSKYISMFKIRMDLDKKAWARLWIKYNDRPYEHMGEWRGDEMQSFLLPVVPKRCDHVRFKLTGHGGAKIYSISRIMEVGGDGV